MTIDQTFQIALEHHQAGRLAEAEELYRQILVRHPRHANSLHFLGMASYQSGRIDAALDLLEQANAVASNSAAFYSNYGSVLKAKGRLADAGAAFARAIELQPGLAVAHKSSGDVLRDQNRFAGAVAAYSRAIEIKPDYVEAHWCLGNVLSALGKFDEAEAAYTRVIHLRPNDAAAHSHLGNALTLGGQHEKAVAAYERAIQLDPENADAHNNLANTYTLQRKFGDAIAAYKKAAQLRPDYAQAYSNLGNVLTLHGNFEEAAAACLRAIELNPEYDGAYSNLGNAYLEQGKLTDARAAYTTSLRLRPASAEVQTNLGNVLMLMGQYDQALAACARAIELKPDYPDGHWNASFALLIKGNFAAGWVEYEWRWRRSAFVHPRNVFQQPRWDGRALDGQTILLHAEQGFGDTIQFIRYAEQVQRRGATVLLKCPDEMHRLMRSNTHLGELLTDDALSPRFDVHCPLMSLPLLFHTTLNTIPAHVPYLRADAQLAAQWSGKLDASRLKVGLAWSGSPNHKNDRNRSMPLAMFGPLAEVKGIRFYSLQKGPAGTQVSNPPAGMDLIDFTSDLHDFADTAALISQLDLVISVDTAVAHLSAAMGKPTWIMLPYAPDWRWMLDREDSPWYPSVHLFRQRAYGQWHDVISSLAARLYAMNSERP